MKRIGRAIAIVVVLWLALLLVLDAIYGDKFARTVEERLAESLQGEAVIARSDLALVRGHLDLAGLSVVRDDSIGHLSLKVDDVRCALPPLGAAVILHGCRELAIRGTRLEISTVALFKLRPPKRLPIRTDRVVIEDATLAFSPSAFVVGLGRVTIHIDRAVAGETTFHTPFAWLLTLEQLEARLELPAGISVKLSYANGVISAAGTLFGSQPVSMALPLHLPSATSAKQQIEQLTAVWKTAAEELVLKRADDWIKSKLP